MSSYEARGFEVEGPYISSRGDFKLSSSGEARIGWPMQIVGQNTGDLKVIVKPYSDTTGITVCVGVALENRYPSGYAPVAYDDYAGMGWRRRDIRLLLWGGPVEMIFMSGIASQVIKPQDLVAPYPSGFKIFSTGEKKFVDASGYVSVLGRAMEYGAVTGEKVKVFVDPHLAWW